MEALDAWYKQIQEHIKETGLFNLSEYETNDGRNPFQEFTNVTRIKESLKPFSYSDFKHADEFNFLSMDLIYVIAILELLHSKINNSQKENGTYFQTIEDHLYLRYAGFGFQIIYSYWDRIGDILALFFRTGLSGDVYLGRVFNNFPNEFRSDKYAELLILYKTEIEPVLNDRHGVVHSFGLKAKHFWTTMEEVSDYEREKLQDEKDGYPALFRHQLDLFFVGFTLTMKLISELPDKIIPSTE